MSEILAMIRIYLHTHMTRAVMSQRLVFYNVAQASTDLFTDSAVLYAGGGVDQVVLET